MHELFSPRNDRGRFQGLRVSLAGVVEEHEEVQ